MESLSGSSSFDVKERIREAIDIVELVSRYVPSLRRQGRSYVGRCPWHDDSRPSLQVSPERQTFKCWVCDIGGDIFSFIMQMEKVDFKEALEILADMAGVALPEPKLFRKSGVGGRGAVESGQTGGPTVSAQIGKSALYRALDWLADKYHRFFLEDPEAEEARKYISERGIRDDMARRFKIGYAPTRPNCLVDLVGGDRARLKVLEAAGVLATRQDGLLTGSETGEKLSPFERDRYYDRFRGRVLFPIRDTQDRTVAFGGRILPNARGGNPAKYVNSPETMIFTKSKMLYGMDAARNNIRKKKRVIITEGYTDCLMAHQFGFDETVAVLGTALGEAHIKILNRFADRIYLILDGDAAGRKRADEVLGLFVAQGADLSILTLPDDRDPCEYLLEFGPDSFENLIQTESVDAMEHAFRSATEGVDLTKDIVGASRALDRLLAIIALFPDESRLPGDPVRLRIAKTIQRLSERFRISEEEIRRNLKTHRSRLSSRPNRDEFAAAEPDSSDELICPSAEFRDETPDTLAERYGKIPVEIWQKTSLLPNQLEREFLEFWFVFPDMFEELAETVTPDDVHSPLTRQLLLLGNDLLNRSVVPTFDRILLRYDSSRMKNFLVGIDESAAEKNLHERLKSEVNREFLLHEIEFGFDRQRIALEEPRQLSDLREEELSDDEKLSRLLEFQDLLKKKQDKMGGAGLMDEDGLNSN